MDQADRPGLPVPSADEVAHELDSLVDELGVTFGHRYDEATIRNVVEDTYRRLAENATVQQHLVPLTKNRARAALAD